MRSVDIFVGSSIIELEEERNAFADIINELKEYGISPVISDPVADANEAKRLYKVEFTDAESIKNMDAVVIAVAHDCFKQLAMKDVEEFYGNGKRILIDIKGLFDRKLYEKEEYIYWRL